MRYKIVQSGKAVALAREISEFDSQFCYFIYCKTFE